MGLKNGAMKARIDNAPIPHLRATALAYGPNEKRTAQTAGGGRMRGRVALVSGDIALRWDISFVGPTKETSPRHAP